MPDTLPPTDLDAEITLWLCSPLRDEPRTDLVETYQTARREGATVGEALRAAGFVGIVTEENPDA